ncbi:MAG TPA: response regulator [Bacteroidota bacterium]|nr:response regulator [Bacteroidota bacterium]
MNKILIIEDDANIRDNIVELLEDEGYRVYSAVNGRDGITAAFEFKPNLIVSDIMMPEVDGYGVLKALRAEAELATTPFIFLTAKADKPDYRTGMELGADDYLTKPFTHEELLQAIRSRLSKQSRVHEETEKKINDLRKNITYALPHELRTPMTGIIGPAKMMLDTLDLLSKDDIREFLRIIHASGERLYRLIQNFLLYSQLELDADDSEQIVSMRRALTPEADLIISKAADDQAIVHKRTSDLQMSVAETTLCIGKEHIEKITSELVDNALKFSKPGDPVIVTGQAAGSALYRLCITDVGKGIKADEIGTIGAFVQFKRKLHEQQGTGLGLTIVKRLIAMHGGTIGIESVSGAGTTVTAMLPRAR